MLEKNTPKVLMVVSQEVIKDLSDGGKKGSFRNYELLKAVFGENNVYICMLTNYVSNEKVNDHILRFTTHRNKCEQAINIMRGRFFTGKRNEEKIVGFICKENINLVFIDRSMFASLIFKIRRASPRCKIWVFVHNLEKNYFKNKLKKMPIISFVICKQIEKSERFTFQQADCVMALTERDAGLVFDIYNCSVKYIIPSSFKDKYDASKLIENMDSKLHLLFIGTMFRSNYEGIKWFVENVMPRLEDVELNIVGKNFELKKSELERDNVNVIGTVDNLDSYYYSNSVMVMPIFWGDGQKVKTVEALMYGKTIVATDESLEGYDVDNTPGIFRCNKDNEFIEVINRLKKNGIPEEYRVAIRNIFLEKYSFQCIVDKYKKKLLDEYEKSI